MVTLLLGTSETLFEIHYKRLRYDVALRGRCDIMTVSVSAMT